MDLFLRDRDPISVHVLACGACELLEGVGQILEVEILSALILKVQPDLKLGKIAKLRNQYWNAMKHFYGHNKQTVRDDAELLAGFSDVQNDTVIWEGWHDYQRVTGRLPIEAQVFQIWYFALNEEKLAPDVDRQPYRQFLPNIRACDRTEQKRRLRRLCERYRHDKSLVQDPRTEARPLVKRRPQQS